MIYDLTTRRGRQNFYQTKEWRRLRERKLEANPLCEICLKEKDEIVAGTVCDHRRSISSRPTYENALDFDNLTTMCVKCHNRKTAIEMGWGKEEVKPILNTKWNIDISSFKR